MAYDPSIFNINPYYDDYDPAKSFLRVLFKPGYAVQARELTQLQSILQDQVSKVGDHLFKDGSRIVGGAISVRNTNYLMVQPNTAGLTDITDYSFVLGSTVKVGNGAAAAQPEGRVVHYIEPDSTDGKLVLVVDFISGASFDTGTSVTLTTSSDTPTDYTITPATDTWANGRCKLVSVDDGIFYVDGFFTRNLSQYFVPGRTLANGSGSRRDFEYGSAFADLTTKVGLAITRDSVTESEDPSLRDPAIGSYNYNAPGADRFKIDLILDQRRPAEDTDDFVELLRFEGGKITRKIERITYGEIEKTLSRRTYDESGSYIVRPFDIKIDLNGATLNYTFGSGKAYIQGYEVESQYPQTVSVPAARTTATETDLLFPYGVGNWIGVCAGFGSEGIATWGSTFSTAIGTTLNHGSADVYFRNSSNVVVGQAKIHGLVPFGFVSSASGLTRGIYKMYLHGVCAGSTIAGAASAVVMPHGFGLGSGRTLAVFGITMTSTGATLNGSNDLGLVCDVRPGYAVAGFSAAEFYTKVISDTININETASYAVASPITYQIDKNKLVGIFTAPSNTAVKFPSQYGVNGTNNASDLQQVTIISTGLAGTTALAYSPGHETALTGFSLSSDGTFLKLQIPGNKHPVGYTQGVVRMSAPIFYQLDNNALTSYASSNIRTKTATAYTHSTISVPTDPSRNSRKYIQLPHWDVYSIVGITYTPSVGAAQNATSWFELDDGQRESNYDYSRVYVKSEKAGSAGAGTYQVSYNYFIHGGLTMAPFVGSNSYVGVTYSHIPLYTNTRTGKTVSLANCLDFRHSGPTLDAPVLKPYGAYEFPAAFANTKVTYSHYLPRIDKIKVKADPNTGSPLFFVDQGTPDLVPVAPPDSEDALTLYTVLVPAYTHKASDVVVTPHDNRRYTMSDIGKIERRVDDVETYASLSISETELESKQLIDFARAIGYSQTAEPLKTSLYVDEFVGHNSGDVVSDEHICSVDYEYGELRPFFTTSDVSLGTATTDPSISVSSDGICTLAYGATAYVENLGYTTTVKPNPTNTTNWLGFLELSRSIDTTWDTSYRPLVKTNALGENDNWISSDAKDKRGFGTQWNDWESLWTGIETREEDSDSVQRSILELPRSGVPSAVAGVDSGNPSIGVSRRIDATTSEKMMSYVKSKRLKNRIKKTSGNRTVDNSVLPYIPTQSITVTAYGLKPNATGLSVFFDGVALVTGLSASSNGTLITSFTIPAGTFTVGEKLVRVSDSFDPQNASTGADAVFYSTGTFEQRDSGSYSTRSPVLRRQSVSSNGIIKTPFNREVSYDSVVDTVENNQWADPLCQTFIVDKKTYPEGLFLTSLDLFFAKADPLLPVTIQIRPTINGYPSPSVSLPFSTVTKQASAVTVDANNGNPLATNFAFTSPVYLEPGEYAIAVVTNSGKYELYASNSSLNTTVGGRAGNNSSVGTLYLPQNTSTWVANNNTDIAFRLNRCSFTTTSGTLQYSNANWSGSAEIMKLSNTEITPVGCSLTRSVGGTAVSNNQNAYFTSPKTSSTVSYSLRRGTNNAVSPVLDIGTFCGKAVDMFVTPTPSTTSAYATSSYVSRAVVLPTESTSQGVFVFTNALIPTGATVNMYCKYSTNGESGLYQAPWRRMSSVGITFTSATDNDFREAVYGITAPSSNTSSLANSISAYQIKAEFLAPATADYSKTPALKNIRVVTWR